MNFQRGKDSIGWCDATWSPVTGCLNDCSYCYARKIATRFAGSKAFPNGFEPTFHPERLEEPCKVKKPSKIFVCSMGELFGPWVPREWQEAVLKVIEENPQHIFQLLTKFPKGYQQYIWPMNAWVGATVTCDLDGWRCGELLDVRGMPVRFVSAEPLLGALTGTFLWGLDWLIIGGQSGQKKFYPPKAWIEPLYQLGIPIFEKDNLCKVWCNKPKREFHGRYS
mgnify:FL=1